MPTNFIELVIFKCQRKKSDSPIKLLNRKRFYPSKSVKYLGILKLMEKPETTYSW